MRRLRVVKTEQQLVYAELRLIRNEMKKANATLDELLRIAIEHFDLGDESDDEELL
jgi:hypothetical protein